VARSDLAPPRATRYPRGRVARKVFISGVAGFLGSHLADAFLLLGDEVVGIDNMIGGYPDNVPAGVDFHLVDCNDVARVREHMRGCAIVYHCAATAYEGFSFFAPHLVVHNVVSATTGMVSAAIASGVRRFVYCSSMARYGEQASTPFVEEMTPRPQDPYGIGKLAAEHLMATLADAHGMDWSIAVPHNIIGPRQKYDDPFRNVASIFINLMLQGRRPFVYGDGEQRRCFSFISDTVTPLVRMGLDPAASRQVINVGPDDEVITINELARAIARIVGFEHGAEHVPGPPRGVRVATCSADKARRLLGYEPKVKLEEGLEQMVDWIKARGPRPFRYHLDLEIVGESTPPTWRDRLM